MEPELLCDMFKRMVMQAISTWERAKEEVKTYIRSRDAQTLSENYICASKKKEEN